jgi:hypothetical protein
MRSMNFIIIVCFSFICITLVSSTLVEERHEDNNGKLIA